MFLLSFSIFFFIFFGKSLWNLFFCFIWIELKKWIGKIIYLKKKIGCWKNFWVLNVFKICLRILIAFLYLFFCPFILNVIVFKRLIKSKKIKIDLLVSFFKYITKKIIKIVEVLYFGEILEPFLKEFINSFKDSKIVTFWLPTNGYALVS